MTGLAEFLQFADRFGGQLKIGIIGLQFQFDRKALLWLKQRLQIVRSAAPGETPERGHPAL